MNSKRLKVGVDIDGVLIDMDPKHYLDFCAREFGWNTSYAVYAQTHSWQQATGQSDSSVMSRAWGVYIEAIEDAQFPIEGAHDALREIGRIADIYLITARASSQLEATERAIRKHLPDIQYIELSMNNLQNKIQPILDFGIDYYIDDSYREISELAKHEDIKTILIPFPSLYGFHATKKWDELKNERLVWLKAWNNVSDDSSDQQKKAVYHQAWDEIQEIILRHVS
ncbi:MAG: hypothetical protein K8Q97_02295 [Candidatus Andersenbacteria bacterium]|nr:hypothetical protein [Candidatus Andersenbacteria bacterium]